MSDFEQIINTRRSIREYDEKDVSDDDILKIIRAGMQAPGSRLGAEPWEFVVVKNKENWLNLVKSNRELQMLLLQLYWWQTLKEHSIKLSGNRIWVLLQKTCFLKQSTWD